MKLRWPNLGRWLLVGVGLAVGAGSGWWFTLKEWQREDLLFRAKWAMTTRAQMVHGQANRGASHDRPYRQFPTCEAARNAGYGRMRAGEPSYRREQDLDGDGVACEHYP